MAAELADSLLAVTRAQDPEGRAASIGIISPYKYQVSMIRQHLREKGVYNEVGGWQQLQQC
jgi:hypothetical protein